MRIQIDRTQQAEVEAKVFRLLIKAYPHSLAQKLWAKIGQIQDSALRLNLVGLIYKDLEQGDRTLPSLARSDYARYAQPPVAIQQFLCDPYFMNAEKVLYPEVLRELIEINSGRYVECVFTGGIGSGKTTAALYTTAYQLYLLSCMTEPHAAFGLDPNTEILFVFQSIRKQSAQEVGYNRFRAMMESSAYFMREFPFNPDLKSKLVFPKRIEVHPVSGAETATIGENVMGGIIDELNYMAVVESSKASVDGGVYDQAVALYNSIARRRKSRFMRFGQLPGILCLVSSRRYPGQFTDVKEAEAETDSTIYVYDKCTWDIKPDAYSGEQFPIFIGDEFRKARILEESEVAEFEEEPGKVRWIPLEHLAEFERDIINALREVAGVATLARYPFIMDIEAVAQAMGFEHPSIFSSDWTDFESRELQFYPGRFLDPGEPRFAHVDLGLTSDSAGVALGYMDGFEEVAIGETWVKLPRYQIDGTLEVRPPKGGEIKFWKIRDLFTTLRELGLNVKWITYDSYQSVDSLQLLHQQGFATGTVSLDTDVRGYDTLKTALYDHRIKIPYHERLKRELVSLERDPAKGKVDHPPHGSKDVADAVAGVVFGLVRRRELYIRHSVSLSQIPPSIREMLAKQPKMRESEET